MSDIKGGESIINHNLDFNENLNKNISPNTRQKRKDITINSTNINTNNNNVHIQPVINQRMSPIYSTIKNQNMLGNSQVMNAVSEEEKELYNKNKQKNIEKFLFLEFLLDITKIEIHLEKLQGYLYWQGLLEYFIWTILLCLFISSPSSMTKIWVFLYHIARATIGLCILKYIPKSFQVVENLKDYEAFSLEDIQIQMENIYLNLIHECEKILKPLLTFYFILTMISILVDVIMFYFIAKNFNQRGTEHGDFAFLLGILGFIICEYVYFSLFFSLRYSFSPEFLAPVRKAVIGFFSDLKDGVKSGVSKVFKRFKKKVFTGVVNRF